MLIAISDPIWSQDCQDGEWENERDNAHHCVLKCIAGASASKTRFDTQLAVMTKHRYFRAVMQMRLTRARLDCAFAKS